MNKLLHFLIVVFFIVLGTGCTNSNEQQPIPILDFVASDYLLLPDYTPISVDINMLNLSQDDLDSIINMNLSYNGVYKPVTERSIVEDGDIIVLDIVFSGDDVEHYELDDYVYFVGSGDFSEAFDKQLISTEVGNPKHFEIKFPEDYHMLEFSGNTVDFEISVESIQTFVCVDDEALVIAYYGFNSMEEVYKYIRSSAEKQIIFDFTYNEILSDVRIHDYPQQAYSFANDVLSFCSEDASAEGMDIYAYCKVYLNSTPEQLKQDALDYFSEIMVLKAITEQKNISYNLIDYEKAIDMMEKNYNMTEEDILLYYDDVSICYEMLRADVETIFSESIKIK